MSKAQQPMFLPAPTAGGASLEERLAELEARVAALEGSPLRPRSALSRAAATEMTPADVMPSPVRLLGLVGRTCLILGGATFIRALVDAGTIHRGWGVALGLTYALTWTGLAHRARQPLDAGFHALASVLIAYPLLLESTARFGILTPGLAAVLLLAVTSLHTWVAWRRDLLAVQWTATLASLGAGFAIMSARQSLLPFLTVFFILGLGSLWLTYGRRWHALRWPTALAADLGVLVLTTLAAWPGGPPEAYRSLGTAPALGFALALAILYLGSFIVRMLSRHRVVNAFEVTQSILVLLVGFGGALRVALTSGSGAAALGTGISLAGLGCYALSARFADDREEIRANFQFYTFLALVFLVTGGAVLLGRGLFGPVMGLLALALMAAGLWKRRRLLVLQSGLAGTAAALGSGLAGWTTRAFLSPVGLPARLDLAAGLTLLSLTAALVLFLVRRPDDAITVRLRLVILPLGALVVTSVGALVIQLCCFPAEGAKVDAGLLAAVRTGLLSGLAIALAAAAHRLPSLELRWLVYPLMVITALKFLFEDLAVGRPLTLFLGFMCFGATLMVAPRLVKPPVPPPGDGPNPSLQEVDP